MSGKELLESAVKACYESQKSPAPLIENGPVEMSPMPYPTISELFAEDDGNIEDLFAGVAKHAKQVGVKVELEEGGPCAYLAKRANEALKKGDG